MRTSIWTAGALAASAFISPPAHAQRSGENAAIAADDAFGTSVGNESIGLYNPGDARGFSPVQAGNVRIEGLYFDQQTTLSSRISGGSTVHVGISSQSYPFPAPTGIADFKLRLPGEKQVVSGVLTYGPWDTYSLEADGQFPVVPEKLSIGIGLKGTRHDNEIADKNNAAGAGVLARWRPASSTEIVAFWGREAGDDRRQQPVAFTDGPTLPPPYPRHYFFGQSWSGQYGRSVNFGVFGRTVLPDEWTLRAGVFRSLNLNIHDFGDFLLSTQPDGSARHVIVGLPPQRAASYSGEMRATRLMAEGARRHAIHFALRGRTVRRDFGGAEVMDFGPAFVGLRTPVPKPNPSFGPLSRDHSRQLTGGVAYNGLWAGVGELGLGIQKSLYRRTIAQPAFPAASVTSSPWLYNATLTIAVDRALAVYGSYTRGLEESGTAPSNTLNRGEAMPPSITEQVDAGFRYAITPKLKLVAGAFQVQKPYFNVNALNVFGPLGAVRHRGLEFSVTGQVYDGLTIVAGTTLIQPRLSGEPVDRGVVGPIPVGPRPRYALMSVTYGPTAWKGVSVDAQLVGSSAKTAHSDNRLKAPGWTELNIGVRYSLNLFGAPATFRAQVLNLTNTYAWNVSSSGSFFPRPSRRLVTSLTADF